MNPMLRAAAERGDINLLYTVIKHDAYVLDSFDVMPFVETPLHLAALAGHLSLVTEIMRLKPSFSWKLNHQGLSPIHLALQQDQRRMVQRFIDVNKELVRVKDRKGITPLHFVSHSGDIDMIVIFLTACPDSIQDVTVRGETALHVAAKNNQYEALEVLVGWLKRNHLKGAIHLENTILNWKDAEGNTILHISALLNNSQMLELLIDSGMYLNVKNLGELTALDIAVSEEIKGKIVKAEAKLGSSTSLPMVFLVLCYMLCVSFVFPTHATQVVILILMFVFTILYLHKGYKRIMRK